MKQQPIQALLMQAVALHQQGQLDQAKALYEKVLAQQPKNFDALHLSGVIEYQRQNFELALDRIKQAIEVNPTQSAAYNHLGLVLWALGCIDEALESYDKALNLAPDYTDAHYNRGSAMQELNRWAEAQTHYAHVFTKKPDHLFLLGSLMHVRRQLCDWHLHDQDHMRLRIQLGQRQKVSTPFTLLTLLDDLVFQKSTAEIWARSVLPIPNLSGPAFLRSKKRPHKTRLAYYSADFHNHATAYLMAQLFECHDRDRFELFAFSFGPDSSDPMRQRLVAAFDHFVDVRTDSDQAIAQRSRDLGIDIAVDLKGYTQGQRVGIFAHRCAPVQVNYLGYPGTMGAPFMDYLIADKVVIPPESQAHYSEQVVYLPHSYQVNDSHREIASTVWRKPDLGLPEEGFVFCCFNNSYKITPHTFASWMRILQAVPGSVLWLLGDNDTAQRNLRRYAQEAGVEPERLVFAPRMPLPEHLARHRAADLFLDTLPCNAHTTASDALWAGLPVLTQQGQAFAARVAASLLHAVGLPELIVHTAQQYEELAIALAQNRQRLEHIKAKLAAQRDTAPLFNAAQQARHIEQAYQTMHERAQAGLAPQGFEVV